MKLVLIGIQGAGKSTQGNFLSEEYNIPYLSSGHVFREMAKEKTSVMPRESTKAAIEPMYADF